MNLSHLVSGTFCYIVGLYPLTGTPENSALSRWLKQAFSLFFFQGEYKEGLLYTPLVLHMPLAA